MYFSVLQVPIVSHAAQAAQAPQVIDWDEYLWAAGILAGAIVIALIVHFILFFVLKRLANRKGDVVIKSLVRHSKGPSLWILPLLALLVALPTAPLPQRLSAILEHVVGLGLIASIAWLVILFSQIVSDILGARYRIDVEDNLVARRIQTQFHVLHRVVVIIVTVVTLSIMLMTIPSIRHIGESLLASAGLAALVVGMAMKPTLSSLIAGIQIALTQPIRLEDAVIVQDEWGWIEEIGTTYVVVRIWDLRRLIVPLTYFIEQPFQNWTRTSADLLAYIYLNVDYTVPLEDVRREFRRICESTKLWKGKVCELQASDSTEHTIQLRALMDARNADDAWNLKCLVRERLIGFLQEKYPGSLPRNRGEFSADIKGPDWGRPPEPQQKQQFDGGPVQTASTPGPPSTKPR
ncbi:MAG TPA: mechanosensitive ion channel domain-containing protein [Candidatus Acidoferrales bacterium]|nr:mechanosensitive ion channel domain-containing protein [Candidatus Acidoferrales bacterium]